MMELRTCALIVTIVSSVTASPHGYGVKGNVGAAARAESIALAGSYAGRGDIPEVVPFGNGFSGSFTKSSSSSSSSASSSSSSSSFSYSGSGAGGFLSHGPTGNTGCSTGACPTSGTNDILTNQGKLNSNTGDLGYAAAGAGSGSISGTNCYGNSCDNNSQKCSNGQCQPTLSNAPPSSYDADAKCASGVCGLIPQTGPSSSQYDDSDDIRFIAHSSKAAQDAKGQASNTDKVTGLRTDSNCRSGNCGPSSNQNSQPNSYESVNQYPNSGLTPNYNKPAIELETPKEDSKCNSGNCNSGQYEPVYGNLPSSYNVPIHGGYDSTKQEPLCNGGKCDYPSKGSFSSTTSIPLSTNYLSPQDSHSTRGPSDQYPGSTTCRGSNCGSAPSSQNDRIPSLTASTDTHSVLPSSNGATLTPTSCNSPNCNPNFIQSSPNGHNVQPAQISFTGPATSVKPSNDKLPVYTGGFGAPAGTLKPNEYDVPATSSNSPGNIYSSPSSQKQSTFGSASTGCDTPNCFDQVLSTGNNAEPRPFSSHTPIVNENGAGQKLPTYTGGFGGPAGMFKPNDFNNLTPVTNSPTDCNKSNCYGSSPVTSKASTQSGSFEKNKQSESVTTTSENLPTYTGGFGGPAGMLKPYEFNTKATDKPYTTNPSYNSQLPQTGCTTPNCNTYVSTTANTQSSATKTTNSVDSSSELPPYTGGFGGPSGVLKPSEFGVSNAPNSNYPGFLSTTPNKPLNSNNLAGCTTSNCHPSIISTTVGTNTQSELGVTKSSTVTSPGYTSNYYRPIGVTYPSPPAVAPYSPSYSNTHPLLSTGNYSTGCQTSDCIPSNSGIPDNDARSPGSHGYSNPNFETKPSNQPQSIGSFEGPSASITPSIYLNAPPTGSSTTSCKTSNCADLPSIGAGANSNSGSYVGTKQQLPAYTSGFGAPVGLFKSNNNVIPTGSATPNNYNKTPASAPATCTSGNCNPSEPGHNAPPSGAHVSTTSAATANAVAYSGGFGGPPGLLTPYDEGKVDLRKIVNELSQGIYRGGGSIYSPQGILGASGTTGQGRPLSNIGALTGSASGAAAHSGSLENVNSGSYGHSVKGNSPCGGGCSGGYQHDLNANGNLAISGARGLSGSGSFGAGGIFASSSASAHASAGAYTKGGYGK